MHRNNQTASQTVNTTLLKACQRRSASNRVEGSHSAANAVLCQLSNVHLLYSLCRSTFLLLRVQNARLKRVSGIIVSFKLHASSKGSMQLFVLVNCITNCKFCLVLRSVFEKKTSQHNFLTLCTRSKTAALIRWQAACLSIV
jgi:pyruvate formate-lyase activating enzyme-like uncharacterized protein